jgi:CRP-like cAMP-binding protein
MADCLLTLDFADGQPIIRQGDAGDAFYLVLEGAAAAIVAAPGEADKEVMQYAPVRE